MIGLPKGWAIPTIDQIADINPRHPRTLNDALPVTFVRMPALSETSWRFESTEERSLGQVRKGFTHFAEGDVLFAKITPCMENGKAAVALNLRNGLGCGTTELHVMRPLGDVDPKYLFYFIHQESFREEAARNFTGTAGQLRVPTSFIKGAEVPLPPLNEQRRIVAKLEKLLSRVNAAQERLAIIPCILKRFRQSVLAAAYSGKLTAVWRDENPLEETAFDFVQRIHTERIQRHEMALAQSSTNGVRRPKKGSNNGSVANIIGDLNTLSLGWCVTRIGDICDCLDRLRVPINKDERLRRQGCIPYYGANGQVGNIDDYIFDEDLVLVVEDETFIGREKPFSYVIKGKSWVNNHAHVLRPLGGMSAEFLNILLSYYDFTPLTSGTTGRRKLNQETLVNAPIRLPPFNEQHEIVRRVEALFKTADALEARYLNAKAHVDKLTQSILAKAFRGELVPQDPNDEPASVLLERITGERNGSAGVKRRSRR